MLNMNSSKGRKGGFTMSILRRFFWGMGALAVTYVVLPKMREMAKPTVNRGMRGVKDLANKGRQSLGEYKFRYNSEVNTHKMPQDTTLEQMDTEKNQLMGIVQQLQERIVELQGEIEKFKIR